MKAEKLIGAKSLGFALIPTGKKRSIVPWAKYQKQLPTDEELRYFATLSNEFGVICGASPGHLVCIDFDLKYCIDPEKELKEWLQYINDIEPGLIRKGAWQQTINKGLHWVVRYPNGGGNEKLASRPATDQELKKDPNTKQYTKIETRGLGGYFQLYDFKILDRIGWITDDEYQAIIESCKHFNEVKEAPPPKSFTPHLSGPADGLRPGDHFNQTDDLLPILEKHGWKIHSETSDRYRLTRPGKDRGWSATWHKEKKLFYVFSSSTEMEPNKAYKPFTVYATLEHGGNFSEASKALRYKNYGG